MKTTVRVLLLCPPLLALAACGGHARDVDRLDRDLLNRAGAEPSDPAMTSALADQIMVDPALVQQANGHSVRPPDSAGQSPLPPDLAGTPAAADRPTLGELAQRHVPRTGGGSGGCYAALTYSQSWALKLPPAVPLPADATVGEAAGNDLPGCDTRVVSFASATPAPRLAAFYRARATAAGYEAGIERRGAEILVAGDHPRDDRAVFVSLTARPDGGTDVDIVSNGAAARAAPNAPSPPARPPHPASPARRTPL